MKDVRAFLAVLIPENVRELLARGIAESLADTASGRVRWLKPARMHLTLRFLGNICDATLRQVAAGLDAAAATTPSFELRLGEMGCFPNVKRPRVLWTAVSGDEDMLQQLKQRVDEMLVPMGWQREPGIFRAHITTGRMKRPDRGVAEQYLRLHVRPARFSVKEVHLIESQLTPTGPNYTVRHTAPLLK